MSLLSVLLVLLLGLPGSTSADVLLAPDLRKVVSEAEVIAVVRIESVGVVRDETGSRTCGFRIDATVEDSLKGSSGRLTFFVREEVDVAGVGKSHLLFAMRKSIDNLDLIPKGSPDYGCVDQIGGLYTSVWPQLLMEIRPATEGRESFVSVKSGRRNPLLELDLPFTVVGEGDREVALISWEGVRRGVQAILSDAHDPSG